jgi:signal recognition particle GTPase
MRDGSVRSSFLKTSFTQLSTEKFAKRLLGDNDVQAVLRRIDRLTQEESRATAAQTFEIIHGLVKNMGVVMEGAAHT